MPVFRVDKTSDFTVISNKILRDKRLSYKGKGLLTVMLSCSDSWDYTLKGLATLSSDGGDSVSSGLKELEKFGYLERRRVRNEKGQVKEVEYIIHEQAIDVTSNNSEKNSQTNKPNASKPKQEKPKQDFPEQAKPKQENPPQYNTNQSNIKEYNTNQSIKEDNSDVIDVIDRIVPSFDDVVDEVCENIECNWFKAPEQGRKFNEQIEGVVGIIAEVLSSDKKMINVSGECVNAELVKQRFRSLNREHIEYVLDCVNNTKTKIYNIKKYLISALFNAPLTIETYYENAVVNL